MEYYVIHETAVHVSCFLENSESWPHKIFKVKGHEIHDAKNLNLHLWVCDVKGLAASLS